MRRKWRVFEYATGVTYSAFPGTRKNAMYEANLAGNGHVAVPEDESKRLTQAFASGRMRGIEQYRSDDGGCDQSGCTTCYDSQEG